jgi:hypothetical protein
MEEKTICDACAVALMKDIREGKMPLTEAEYRGRKVTLNKPMRGDVKKFKVYVKDPKTGNVKKVNFGHGGTSAKKAGQKTMRIKKSNPKLVENHSELVITVQTKRIKQLQDIGHVKCGNKK